MSSRTSIEQGLGWLYDQINGEEDARVCKDIPDAACVEQPRNFFAYLLANFCNKVSDELVSARITLPWLFHVLGVPVSFTGFLVPIREAGVLLPQLFVAAYVRAMTHRKIVWIVGAVLSALTLFCMAIVASLSSGVVAGWLLILCLVFYSLARGLCSVSAKDILGKTISKTRRGRLMGYSASLAGVATLLIGLSLQASWFDNQDRTVLVVIVFSAGVLWLLALASFAFIAEPAGATEGGGNAVMEALRSLRIIVDDNEFRQYLVSRILLLSVALVIPFYVLLVQQSFEGALSMLGILIIINGLAGSLSAPLLGAMADSDSRRVMALAAVVAGVVGLVTCCWSIFFPDILYAQYLVYILFFLIELAHGATRLGRKVYLVDMANTENRAQYVAVSNTVIGIVMLFAGAIGVIADIFSIEAVILLLSVISLLASVYIARMRNVSG